MQTKKCEICGTSFEPKKVFQKYCKIQCAWKNNTLRRKNFSDRIIPDEYLIRKKRKEYGIKKFDWRDYPYGAIV